MTSERTKQLQTPSYEAAYEELHRALVDERDATQLLISAQKRVAALRVKIREIERANA